MRIRCPRCHMNYRIPRGFLSQREKSSFQCEKCGEQIQLNTAAEKNSVPGPHASPSKRAEPQTRIPPKSSHDSAKVEALKSRIRMSLMGFIPPVAHVIMRAHAVMADPRAGIRDLAQVIETDPGITARALKVANSAYYGLSGKVTSITHASVLLGNRVLGEIISMAGIRGFLGEKLSGYGLDSETLWRHSLAVAIGSRLLAEKRCPEMAGDAFVTGLIHDAGMIMLDSHIYEKKDAFDEIVGAGSHSLLEGEKELLGIDHAVVGAEMFREWGLPLALVKPVQNHHSPLSSGGELGYIVHMADILARRGGYGTGVDDTLYSMSSSAVEFMGYEDDELTTVEAEICEAVDKM